jgi:hypothetical protein
MRALFTIASLLVVLAIVGVLAKKQMTASVAPAPGTSASGTAARATPQQQVRQYQKNLEGAMQQARPMPDDPK